MITYFKTVTDTSNAFYREIGVALDRIKDGASKELVEKIRSEVDKDRRNDLKKNLPCILFSGKFSKRSDKSLIEHSGFICLDFDGFMDSFELDLFKSELKRDPYTFSVFDSPSGDGLKVIVKIPKDQDNHKNYFLSLQQYYNRNEFDTTSKNLSRVCYESYDPNIFVNYDSEEFNIITVEEHESYDVNTSKPTIRLNDDNEVIKRLFSWWNTNYGLIPGQRNNNVFILASAFNEYGIDKSKAIEVMSDFTNHGFPINEIKTCVESAYKDYAKFNTKFFEDKEKINGITELIKKGMPVLDVADLHKDVPMEVIASAISTDNAFWTRNKKGQISHVNHLFKDYIENLGYRKYYYGTGFVFVRIESNIMEDTDENHIKDDVLDSLLKLDDLSIYNYFSEKTKLFKEDHLSLINRIEPTMWRDTKEVSYFYYKNCVVKVTSDKLSIEDYMTIDGIIWKKQLIDREFKMANGEDAVFRKFIHNVGNNEEDRIDAIETAIGFLLHTFKPAGYCPAIIINDEVISDNPEGGTGKGMIINAIGKMRNHVGIDGKMFQFGKSFQYQRVSADTNVIAFDDVNKGFDFEKLFSLLTEGITIEKKNKDEIRLSFEESPKVVITTNYAIRGGGNSNDRRKFEIELAEYYKKAFTPADEFGHFFFQDWDNEEWLLFDNYMISCLQKFLSRGLVEAKFKSLSERKLIAETHHDFYEWSIDPNNKFLRIGSCYTLKEIYTAFWEDYPDFSPMRGRISISMNKFKLWVDKYAEYAYGQKPSTGRTDQGRCITFERYEPRQIDLWNSDEFDTRGNRD